MSARVSVLALIVMASGGLAGAALAQSATPAEVPPESYDGVQYVDSAGCMYIRAGHGGRASWVPRVDPDRNHICGQTPTFASQPAREAPAPEAEDPAQPRVAEVSAPRPERPAAQPATQGDTTRRDARVEPERTARTQTGAATQPGARAASRVVGVSDEAPSRNAACPDRAPYGQRVTLSDGRGGIRCTAQGPDRAEDAGPERLSSQAAETQAERPTPAQRADTGSQRVVSVPVAPITRNARCPDHAPYGQRVILEGERQAIRCVSDRLVAQARSAGQAPRMAQTTATSSAPVATAQRSAPRAIPEGYKPAWEDDRLNPHRARGTSAGEAQMRRVWTDTLPRQLVTPQAGAGARLARRSDAAAQSRHSAQADDRDTQRVSSRAAGGSFVQVGTYGVPDNARNVARRMEAMGYPVRSRSVGGGLQVVMAGPFDDDAATRRALNALRGAGFGDAFVR